MTRADKEKRSLREFLRHINDYTYRFDPERGRFRYRELRGVRDTAFDFYMWLKCWKDMVAFVAKCPVSAVRGVHMLWVAQDLLDSRTISKRDMRRQVNLYMQTVMGEEPVRPDLVDFDDALTW